jgi:hypothetical protein
MSGLAAGLFAYEAGEDALRQTLTKLADFLIDGPSGAAVLDDGSITIEPNMSNLSFSWHGSVENRTIVYESSANSAPERDVKDRVVTDARAGESFAKGCDIRVVINTHRTSQTFPSPIFEGEAGPALDLVRASNAAGFPIDGAPEADGRSHWLELVKHFVEGGTDLFADASGAAVTVDEETTALVDFQVLCARDDLKLGAAGFDAEKAVLARGGGSAGGAAHLKYSGSLPGFHLMLQPMLGF